MKKLFSLALLAMMMVTGKTFAQSSLLATLSHEGNISVFHGAASLKQAMAAAAHGDIITLSSGNYDAVTIDKAVTLRGAGMEEDSISGAFRTRIVGDFTINIPDSIPQRLSVEGIYHTTTIAIKGTLNNAIFQKCWFYTVTYSSSSSTKVNSFTMLHSRIGNQIVFPTVCSANFINCWVQDPINSYGGSMEFTNCLVRCNLSLIYRSLFTNCIIYHRYDSNAPMNESCMASYCVGAMWKYSTGIFSKVAQSTNKTLTNDQYSALFKSGGSLGELTASAKKTYVGNDGTEVGLYGGNLPYTTRILSPQITKCNVAAKTTADGKLSVDIEVKAAE